MRRLANSTLHAQLDSGPPEDSVPLGEAQVRLLLCNWYHPSRLEGLRRSCREICVCCCHHLPDGHKKQGFFCFYFVFLSFSRFPG